MARINPDVDVVLDILKTIATEQPDSTFIQSLLHQYQERGGLSKKQLQGLYGKASKSKSIAPGRLATLEAIILKKHTRFRSPLPPPTPLYEKDESTGQMINMILEKYPQHKRVLFFRSKFENNEPLTAIEISELQKFNRLLIDRDKS